MTGAHPVKGSLDFALAAGAAAQRVGIISALNLDNVAVGVLGAPGTHDDVGSLEAAIDKLSREKPINTWYVGPSIFKTLFPLKEQFKSSI